MFEFIRGKMVQSIPSKAVVDVGGIGYGLVISLKTFQKLPAIGTEVFFYVAPVIREDGHFLYGFLSLEDKRLFEQLISISGVGPKTAIGILGHVDIGDFQMAVVQGNTALLSKIPGIGKKTAERLVVELKDKFNNLPASDSGSSTGQGSSVVSDAISALTNLGYNPLDAQKAIKKVLALYSKEPSLSELITGALRSI
ncbi:MAG: Holliday junction branch migration protein RuvA [Verrucomicrobia bacterium]|nr:Holliday junction branch migration protein RuvA [Verrucomicrobiota bacterium]